MSVSSSLRGKKLSTFCILEEQVDDVVVPTIGWRGQNGVSHTPIDTSHSITVRKPNTDPRQPRSARSTRIHERFVSDLWLSSAGRSSRTSCWPLAGISVNSRVRPHPTSLEGNGPARQEYDTTELRDYGNNK